MRNSSQRLSFSALLATMLVGCAQTTPTVAQSSPAENRVAAAEPLRVGASAGETRDAARTLKPDDFKGLAWRSVGPANMGGRVADVAINPGNAKTYYVGYGTSGLFKTTNAGTTFAALFDKEATASIGSVAAADAPGDWPGWKSEPPPPAPLTAEEEKNRGKGKIVWVGTGEGNGRNSSSYGRGVYRSTDGGATFKNVGLPDSHDIPRLAVDPRSPDVCYVAALGHLWGANAERGIYKTSDGGATWQHVLKIDENTGAIDVIVDPKKPDTVYAAMYQRRRTAWSFKSGGTEGGIYRSRDAGATWSKLTNGLPEQTGRIGLDAYVGNPQIVYAVIESDLGGAGVEPFDNRSRSGGVFRSEDGGDTWKRLSEFTPRSFYFSKIRIDPKNDQRVYVLGYGLSISDDGGKTFRAGGARKPHGDLHAMVIDPGDTDHLLLGTDGGVYSSFDRGQTWNFLNYLATGEFYNVAVDNSDPYRIGGGLQDNGSWIGPSATGWQGRDEFWDEGATGFGITNADWWFINDGDGFHVAFDPADRSIVYAESQGGVLVRIHLDTGRRKLIRPGEKEGNPRYRFNWNSPFLVSPHDASVLYLGGNHVFKLLERGERWERISDDLSTRDPAKIMSVGSDAETHGTVVSLAESPLNKGTLWAGTDDGLIHVTRDDGKTWTNVTPAEVSGWYIAKIEPSHHAAETAYVAVDGHRNDHMDPHIFMTADTGKTWKAIESDLPKGAHVKCIREDHWNADVLYAGSEQAAYVSIDRGQHWTKMNGESLPTVAVDDIVQHPRETDLVAGTHGRSIYVFDDASALSQTTPAVLSSELHLFAPLAARPRLFLDYQGLWGDQFFKAANPPAGAKINYWVREFTGDPVTINISTTDGVHVRKLTGSNRPGYNRVVWDLLQEPYDRHDYLDETMLGQKRFVPAGEYRVTISYGKRVAATTVRVLAGP
ncbi:Dispase autolysis-inducing protein precursor [Phycisphaerae bacterium RAS1]|nr:Dispase autolysis-inducing protein precursor [Phycisphaerae bacterium RAS1]